MNDLLFISWGDFQAGASGRFAIIVLAIVMLLGWLAPILVRRLAAREGERQPRRLMRGRDLR